MSHGGDQNTSGPRSSASADDAVLRSLQTIERELGRLNERMDRLEGLAREGESIAAIAADTLDDQVASMQARGVDVEARMLQALRIAEALTSPAILDRMESLMRKTNELEAALHTIEELPGLAATAADAVDTMVAGLQARGIDIDERLHGALMAADHLTSPSALRALHAMFGTEPEPMATLCTRDELSPMLQVLVDAAESLQEARDAKTETLGMFGLLRALSEPHVREATTFAVNVARGLGRRLKVHQRAQTLLPKGENA